MSTVATAGRPPRRFHWPVVVAIALAFALVGGIVAAGFLLNRPSVPASSMFDMGDPGTPAALQGLEFAQKAGIDTVIPYNFRPATIIDSSSSTPRLSSGAATYMSQAQTLGRTLEPSLIDQLDNTKANDQAVATTIKLVDSNPAVSEYMLTDEKPVGPGDPDNAKNLAALRHRCLQVESLTKKPIFGVFAWGDNRAEAGYPEKRFLEQIHAACPAMNIGIDYYPFPQTPKSVQNYGPVDNLYGPGGKLVIGGIPDIAATLNQVGGLNTTFVAQAMGWSAYPDPNTGGPPLGFPANSPPPSADLMAWMLKVAVYGEGHGGVGNVSLYSFTDAVTSGGNAQLAAMQQAMASFQASP